MKFCFLKNLFITFYGVILLHVYSVTFNTFAEMLWLLLLRGVITKEDL